MAKNMRSADECTQQLKKFMHWTEKQMANMNMATSGKDTPRATTITDTGILCWQLKLIL